MKDKKYLKYIHDLPCVVTGCEPYGFSSIVAHHITVGSKRGISQKPSDYRCIPMEASEHMRLHHLGEGVYWEQMGINPFEEAIRALRSYADKLGVGMPITDNLDTLVYFFENR